MNKWKKIEKIASYLSATSKSTAYSGFTGQLNLGDEVLESAICDAFNPLKLVYYPFTKNKFINSMAQSKSHALAILGGGTLIGKNLSDGSNHFRESFQAVLSRSNSSVVFGTGVGKLSNDTSKNTWLLDWQSLLKNCSYIGVRGPQSVQSLASVNLEAELLGDPACLVAQENGFWKPQDKTIGINVGFNLVGAQPSEIAMIEQMIKFITHRSEQGWKIEFFVVCPQDVQIVKTIIKDIGLSNQKVHYIFENATPYLMAARSLTAFIGVKLHSVVLAMCAGVPSIMIEYAPKCRDFMMSVGMEELSIDIKDVTSEKLDFYLDNLLPEQKQIASKITERMIQLKEKQLQKAAEIRDWVI